MLGFFQDHVLSAARPEGMERGLGKDVTIRKAMDASEPKIAAAFPGQPSIEAAVRTVLGETYYYLESRRSRYDSGNGGLPFDRPNSVRTIPIP